LVVRGEHDASFTPAFAAQSVASVVSTGWLHAVAGDLITEQKLQE
jgi:hypothetical protein